MIKYLKNFFSIEIKEDDYKEIECRLMEKNREALVSLCKFSIVLLILLIGSSFFNAIVFENIVPYIFALVMSIILYCYSKYSHKNIMIAVYLFLITFLILGILIGTVKSPEMESVSYIAFLLIVPLVFIYKPINILKIEFISNLVFAIMVIMFKPQSIWAFDLGNSFIFALISVFSGTHMMKIKFQELTNETKLRKFANLDLMTGLYNRNYFENSLNKYSNSDTETCYCFYVDVNGLHELNNEKGHDAGDKMLIYVANTLKELFFEEDSYRIGGDEFLICGTHKTEQDVEKTIKEFIDRINKENYSASTGLEYQKQTKFDIVAMMKLAEEKMMDNKRSFYEKSSYSRRRTDLKKL